MSDGEINVDSIDGEVSTSASIVGQLYPQGEKGDKGDPGNDGFSPTVTTEKVGKTTTITITDAQGEHTATILDGQDGQGSGDMLTSVYDTDHNGIVDNAEKVNGKTVLKDVPADAVFTDTTYTAGTGIDITGNVITNTQTSAEWGNITGTLSDQTDLKNALDDKADTSSLSSVATSGSYTDLSDKPSIPTKVSDLNNDSGFIDKDVNNLTNYDTSTTVDTKISNSEEVLIGSDSGIKASHELWVDTSDVTPYINSEISNDYGTAQNVGYSQEYVNDRFDGTKPMGDVVVDSIKSKNLYNINSDIQNQILNSSGRLTQGTRYVTSVLIKVKPNTNYTISRIMDTSIVDPSVDSTMRIGYFTSSKTFISRPISTDAIWTVTTPANCEYVRISYKHTISGQEYCYNVQLEEGSTATAYTPYQELNSKEVYSVNETIIGTWDGKPLYRKIVEFTSPTGNTSFVSVPALSIANAIVRNYHAVINLSNGYVINENYQESAYSLYSLAINISNGNVYFPQHTSITTSATITLTIEYTKTTD